MPKEEIYYNEKINNYTLEKEIDGVKSIKRIPLKFKLEDSTAKYRQEILKEELLKKS